MRTLSRFSRTALILTGLLASSLPSTATAASGPVVYCMKAFSSDVPAKCDPGTFPWDPEYRGIVTPNSRPYGNWPTTNEPGYPGVLYVEGNADAGSRVTVTVSDGSRSISEVVFARTNDDAGTEEKRGDFRVAFDPMNNPNMLASLAELGTHAADTGDNAATVAFPGSGKSTLTVTAVAEIAGVTGSPLKVFADKYAASPLDAAAPALQGLRWPPQHWCHYSSRGAQMPGANQHMGGDDDGRCGQFSQEGLGAIPDATWVACLKETSELPDDVREELVAAQTLLGGPYCDYNCMNSPFRPYYCRTNYTRTHPHGEAPVMGLANDWRNDGTGSEIKSVLIEVLQGSTVVKSYTDRFSRTTSTTARWGFTLKINDFQPNWPIGTPYIVKVTATDAWGRTSTAQSSTIYVYPY